MKEQACGRLLTPATLGEPGPTGTAAFRVLNRRATGTVIQVMEGTQVATFESWRRPVLRVAGAGLLTATAAIHLDLYLTGYRNIPTIGWLFLLQVIAGFVLAAAVLATGNQVVAALGAGFAVATLGGYLLSIWVGLFGFTEVRTTAGIVAGIIEVAAFAVLALLAVTPVPDGQAVGGRGGPLQELGQKLADLPLAQPAIGVLSVVALVLLIVAVAGAGPTSSAPSGGTVALKTGNAGGATVLTNAKGLTVYWFAADSPGKSNCYGDCAAYWPPVTGSPSASGVPGTFGTTTRTDGTKQVTWNGHPLYTYVGDSAPGQANGNNLDLNGGVWHEIVVSG
jgi:predicted lipoprotein with Yx(FWY)xxD motif